jgi:succinate-acetate transporter protein
MEATAASRPDRRFGNGQAVETAAPPTPPIAPSIADPAPLGLAAFALTTFVLSFFNAGLVSDKGEPVVLGLTLFYGGVAQLLAGMWEFRNNNTFGATAFSSFGAFWLSFWALNQFYASKIPTGEVGSAVGLYLIAWGIFTAYMLVASLRTTAAISLVFLLLTITFVVLGIGQAGAHTSVIKAGGWIGLATAIVAWYASFAGVTNSTFGRTVLPVRPFTRT